jgi:hypothetical protein
VDLLPHKVDNRPPYDTAGHRCGDFHPPTDSEGDEYSSYSQLFEQGSTCYHCCNAMTTYLCPTCTYGVDFTCAGCTEEWFGNEDDCLIGDHGFYQWKRKLGNTKGHDMFGIDCPVLKVARQLY